jgi:hypothetical protein
MKVMKNFKEEFLQGVDVPTYSLAMPSTFD